MARRDSSSKFDPRYLKLVETKTGVDNRKVLRIRWDRVVPIAALCAFWIAVAWWLL